MRAQNQLLTSRTEVRSRFALIPLEGIPNSRLPHWPNAAGSRLASPALGANFGQYLIDLERGQGAQHTADGRVEQLPVHPQRQRHADDRQDQAQTLTTGSFALVPPTATTNYKPAEGEPAPVAQSLRARPPMWRCSRRLSAIRPMSPRNCLLQRSRRHLATADPRQWQYSTTLQMNIFLRLKSAIACPSSKHTSWNMGCYLLEGKGTVLLGTIIGWRSRQRTSSGWAHSARKVFYATGPVASKYIYYKKVNREIPLCE